MSKNKNDRVSPANIIAIIAVAALGVMTFFGVLFMQERSDLGMAAIQAACYTVVIGLLLVVCIVAKKTEKEFSKWRLVEYISLAAYLAVAIIFYKPCIQFFHVVQHKSDLQTMAISELVDIEQTCAEYNATAEKGIDEAAESMKNYKKSGQNNPAVDGGLRHYMDTAASDIEEWAEDALDLASFRGENLDDLRQRISDWNLMDLSDLASDMEYKSRNNWYALTDKIELLKERNMIPVIEQTKDDARTYRIVGLVDFNLGDEPWTSAFTEKFREPASGFNIGFIVYIVLHLLALTNYLLVRRSPIIQIRKDKRDDDGGLMLEAEDKK